MALKIIEYLAKAVLLIFAIICLIGLLWFMGNIYAFDFIYGVIGGISGLVIGVTPLKSVNVKNWVYLAFCFAGAVATIIRGINYFQDQHRPIDSGIEQFVIALCFIVLAILWRRTRYNKSLNQIGAKGAPPG